MYFVKTPALVSLFYPSLTWQFKGHAKAIYLTFDDGPDPTVTPAVLDLLDTYDAKATFFCVGEKVKNNPKLYQDMIDRGHTTGNHTFNHLNGKNTPSAEYFENVTKAANFIDSELFRPPYGHIRGSQIQRLKRSYHIIMWTVLPGDFDQKTSKEEVLKRSVRNTRNGSIIVFHDNGKFKEKMLYALKGYLSHFVALEYTFKAINTNLLNEKKE